MNILVHDYAGHPFQVGLSRALCRRGHTVKHVYFADNPGPKGFFEVADTPQLEFAGISLGRLDQKSLPWRRRLERRYGHEVANLITAYKPDVVISGNTPTDSQCSILKICRARGIRFVYWVQDVYSIAVTNLLTKRLGLLGQAIGAYYRHLDKKHYRASDAIVVITEDFIPLAAKWSQREQKVSVIENWASIEDIPTMPKKNAWAEQHGLAEKFCYLYSGTLGRKHNPDLLGALADMADGRHVVCVAGQGTGLEKLHVTTSASLVTLPLQPIDVLPSVLASADVLIATIEPDASTFAVPSKVLSYLCAGRPILLSAPESNLAAKTVERAGAGIVVPPGDVCAFLRAAIRLRENESLRCTMGRSGRQYAERTFNLESVADAFERVLAV